MLYVNESANDGALSVQLHRTYRLYTGNRIMSQIRLNEKLGYFIQYAGSRLKIWRSIVGQEITHYLAGPGTIIDIEKYGTSIYIKVRLHAGPVIEHRGVIRNLPNVFTHLTLSGKVARDLETHHWNIEKDGLLNQLRNLASRPSIDCSTFKSIYNQLMKMDQTRKIPKQTLQQINEYHQEFMDGRQKLIDRKQFFDLSAKAMNPNVETCYSLPKLDENDLRLVEKWHDLRWNSLDRTSLINTKNTDWELGRLFSARSAEKVAADFYQHYRKKVTDISITQIDENSKSEWEKYDLNVDGLPIDVKNSRRSRNSPDRYTKHCVPKFKHNRKGQDVIIAGVFSPYLQVYELLGKPEPYRKYREIQFLGETTQKSLQTLKNEFNDLVDFVDLNSESEYFLPPWVFDYPEYVYTERNEALKVLKNFSNLDSLKGAPFKFNLYPVSITVGIDLTEILGNEASEEWEQRFLNQLRGRIDKYGLSLPFLFLTILAHFLDMAASSKTVSDFKPNKYRKFLFYEEPDKPLGIYDPLGTIDALIKALSTLWTAENGLIRKFRMFKLST